jgi:ketosteroid isomerase-like protein
MRILSAFVFLSCITVCAASPAQVLDPLAPHPSTGQTVNPLTEPTATPGIQFLYQLEAKFAADTAKGGGRAFAAWFAPDAVTLENGKAPVEGHDAIAAAATWSPESYQLTWKPEGARMSANGDMGLTWGHYEGVSKDKDGNTLKDSGRYMTVWKKQPDGSWKVQLDSSNDGPPADCCSLH